MPVINNSNNITDAEIETALGNTKKMERLIDKVFRAMLKQPESKLKQLRQKMIPFSNVMDDDIDGQRRALKSLKEFLNNK